MSSVKSRDALWRTNATLKAENSRLQEEIEEWENKYEGLSKRKDTLQEALGIAKAETVETVNQAKQFRAELQERHERLDEEILDRLRPLQGKYSALSTEHEKAKKQAEKLTEEISELESNYASLESQLIAERAKHTEDFTETHPELMPLLEFLHEKSKEHLDAKTQYESSLEKVVEKFKTTKPHKTMRYCEIRRESDGEIMKKKDDFSFKYKNILEHAISNVDWTEFDENNNRIRSDFDEAIEYIDWAKKMDNFNQNKIRQTQKIIATASNKVGNILHFTSAYKMKRANKALLKTYAERDKLIQDCPITNERFDEIFQINGSRVEAGEWIHLMEPSLQIHDKLDEKTYTQLRENYLHMKEKENISVFALENILEIRSGFLE